jgi:hypothetical protein
MNGDSPVYEAEIAAAERRAAAPRAEERSRLGRFRLMREPVLLLPALIVLTVPVRGAIEALGCSLTFQPYTSAGADHNDHDKTGDAVGQTPAGRSEPVNYPKLCR